MRRSSPDFGKSLLLETGLALLSALPFPAEIHAQDRTLVDRIVPVMMGAEFCLTFKLSGGVSRPLEAVVRRSPKE